MKTASQHARILSHLKAGRKLTRAQALNDLGIANVTARITELRHDGHPIEGYWKVQRNRFGEVCKFMVYYMPKAA